MAKGRSTGELDVLSGMDIWADPHPFKQERFVGNYGVIGGPRFLPSLTKATHRGEWGHPWQRKADQPRVGWLACPDGRIGWPVVNAIETDHFRPTSADVNVGQPSATKVIPWLARTGLK